MLVPLADIGPQSEGLGTAWLLAILCALVVLALAGLLIAIIRRRR